MNPKLWRDILYEFPATHYYRLFHGVLSIDNDPEQLQSLKKLYAQLLRKVIWQNEADFYGKTADGKQEYSPSEFVSRQFREEASF